ncbi:MAG: sulfatase-like hydrolase/transferase [Acidobacteriota bacterium]
MHPIVRYLIAALAVRTIGIAAHYLGSDVGGRPISSSPLTSVGVALAYHTAVLATMGASFLVASRVAGRSRRWVEWAAAGGFAASMLLGQLDLALLRHIGQNLTPSIVGTYVGSTMMTPDLWQPILFDWRYTVTALGLVVAGWMAIGWMGRPARGSRLPPSWRSVGAIVLLACCAAAPLFAVGGQRAFVAPPEANISWFVSGGSTAAPTDERQARSALQEWLDPDRLAVWPDPDYPLLHSPRRVVAPPRSSYPDVIVLMVESLRGRDVGYLKPPGTASLTPNLDRVAARGVVFSHFISNGFPTAPGFFTLNTALWSHRDRIVTSHFTDLRVDAIAPRLAARGYRTVWLDGSNPSFDNQLAWGRRWFQQVRFDVPGNHLVYVHRLDDRAILRRAADTIRDADSQAVRQPLFLFVSTSGMHPPFTLETSLFAPFTAMGDASRMDTMGIADVQARYNIVLAAFDRSLGELLEVLTRRANAANTVLVITGDHSSATADVSDPDLRSMPGDEAVWTTAVVEGPERLVGRAPRVETFPASHVDLMPTVLAMIGDDGPTAAMGRDLFDRHQAGRSAIAVRPGGYRLDRGAATLLVRPDGGGEPLVLESFQQPVTRHRLEGSPFSHDDARRLREAVEFVSYLIERNRVWPSSRKGPSP